MLRSGLGLLAACGASCLYDLGVALQALEARVVPVRHSLRPSLLGRLGRRRRWLGGTGLALLGWPLQVVALLLAPLTLVQPALALGLLLLLWLGVRLLGERVGRREIGAVLAIGAGVALMAWAAPGHTSAHAGPLPLAVALGSLAVPAVAPYLAPGRDRGARLMVVLGAGAAYAWTGVASKLISDELARGHLPAALAWASATGGMAALGLTSEMTALQRRQATHVAPVVYVVQVVVPVLLAPLLGGEGWGSTPLGGGVVLGSLLTVAAGAAALTRSPAVASLVAPAEKLPDRNHPEPLPARLVDD
jgi:drug/metabolite transporter (DMT)-like permease